jgi:hypothetical protein
VARCSGYGATAFAGFWTAAASRIAQDGIVKEDPHDATPDPDVALKG